MIFFIFKQKTAYEMRISDWSSNECSSDLHHQSDDHRRCRRVADLKKRKSITMTETEQLAAHIAITQVKARYCRLLDTKDWAGYAKLFTEDFELDVSEGSSLTVIRGRDAAELGRAPV